VEVAMDRQSFLLLPQLYRTHFSPHIGGDFFPGIQTVWVRRRTIR